MRISVCIPVYNYDVRELVSDLHREISLKSFDAEIVLIDDCSDDNFKSINSEIDNFTNKFIYLNKNVGRSKIRNLFLRYAGGDFFLFLDCDGKIINENFLSKYKSFIEENPQTQVIYGGRSVGSAKPGYDQMLRWNYAVNRENFPASIRRERPFTTFQTNNFIINKKLFSNLNFNEQLTAYGYEDLLFAFELKNQQIPVAHIDNDILNGDVETNRDFIHKTRSAVRNIKFLICNYENKKILSEIKLIKAYHVTQKYKLSALLEKLFLLSEHIITQLLESGKVPIFLLDLYKLGYLTTL